MRPIILAVLASALLVHAVPTNDVRFVDIAGNDGKVYEVDLEAEPDLSLLNEITRNPANNQYLLYTRRNPDAPERLILDNENSVFESNYQFWRPTVVIVHGHKGSQDSELNAAIKEAYLEVMDANVIVMDWRELAAASYSTAARGVPEIGKGLAEFIKFLVVTTHTYSYDPVHLVGFDLGAHVIGNAGRELEGKVGRITGLDPVGRRFSNSDDALRAEDGKYVEVIHTSGGFFGSGIGDRSGDVDFFANGGSSQPGCWFSACSHERAWQFFAASVKYNHLLGQKCNTNLQVTLNRCNGEVLKMGNGDVSKEATPGIYRVNTQSSYPF